MHAYRLEVRQIKKMAVLTSQLNFFSMAFEKTTILVTIVMNVLIGHNMTSGELVLLIGCLSLYRDVLTWGLSVTLLKMADLISSMKRIEVTITKI